MYHNVLYKEREIKIYLREVGCEDGGGYSAFICLVLRFSECYYNDKEREREREREEKRDFISLVQSSSTLLEVIAKRVYKFKMLYSH